MPQQFGDAQFNGNVRIKGRLQLDHALSAAAVPRAESTQIPPEIVDKIAVLEERISATQVTPDMSKVYAEVESQQTALNVLQREVGALVASMHTSQDSESPTVMSALKLQQQEFSQQQQLLREQQKELTVQHESLQRRLEQKEPSFASSEAVRQMQGELQALRQQIVRIEPSSNTALESELKRVMSAVEELQSSKPSSNTSLEIELKRVMSAVEDLQSSKPKRYTAMQTLDATEVMVQTYVSDLRNEFVHAQRDTDFAGMKASFQNALDTFKAATSDRVAKIEGSVASLSEAVTAATEKTEATRRQLASLIAEVDSIRQIMRQWSNA